MTTKKQGAICACNWFVSQDVNGIWIHQDGKSCGLADCDASQPIPPRPKEIYALWTMSVEPASSARFEAAFYTLDAAEKARASWQSGFSARSMRYAAIIAIKVN